MKKLIYFMLPAIVGIFLPGCRTSPESPDLEKLEEGQPGDWFYEQRAYPHGRVDQQLYRDGIRLKKAMEQTSSRNNLEWEFAGPTNVGGRITDVEMHASSMDVLYAATASGGIFKSEDRGESWTPIFDDALSLAIGDIGIAPSDPDILYVGTGESNGGGGSLAYNGAGMFKSTDGGEHWQHLGLEDIGSAGKVLVHPEDPDRVWVAAMGALFANNEDRGVYRTSDGGESWEQVLFVSDSTGFIDLVIHPDNPDILYAAAWERLRRPDRRQYGGPTSGIYRSVDGGDTWTELTSGLPAADKGRIGLAVTPAAPEMLYALYTDSVGFHKDILRSDDGGDNWTIINSDSLSTWNISYAWWMGKIYVHPQDPETIFAFNLFTYKSTDGGDHWDNVNYFGLNNFVHVDPHSLFIHPQDPDFIVLGNDGGVYISENGGDSWDHKNTLPITQFYTCEVDHTNPERLYGGTQDNGTIRTLTGAPDNWEKILGNDGMVVKVDPLDSDIIFAEWQNGILFKSIDNGANWGYSLFDIDFNERRNWKTPYILDPNNSQRILYGTFRIHQSTDQGESWSAISPDLALLPSQGNLAFGTVTTIDASPIDGGIIYAGTDNGRVWNTTDGGESWNLLSQDLPNRWVTAVATHPADPQTAYVTFSGYRYHEYQGHVFRTTDGGNTWNDISTSLPEVPVNDIVVDPENPDWLYLATDVGVFFSIDEGENWEVLGAGLPNVVISDLCLHHPTRRLIAATYGRSMYTISVEELVSSREGKRLVKGMKVFPNPATGIVTVSFNLEKKATAEVLLFDHNGRMMKAVFQGQLVKGDYSYTVDLADLPAGNYVCQVTAGINEISRIIVKK